MDCRLGCGACCVAPSISSLNKPANVRCEHLSEQNLCLLFGKPERPQVCVDFKATEWICGTTNKVAMYNLIHLERLTS